MPRRLHASSAGFTLVEILVALVLIGLLVGTLVPTVVSQVGNGELNRVQEDVQAVNTASKAFRTDVGRWPGDMEDLVVQPLSASTADSVLVGTGGQYLATQTAQWAGPYLELGSVGTGLSTALGGVVLNRLGSTTWNTKPFLTVKVLNIGISDAQTLSQRIDGDTLTGPANDAAGKIRWKLGSSGADTLLYLGSPVL
jgi:type II secretion system protein G